MTDAERIRALEDCLLDCTDILMMVADKLDHSKISLEEAMEVHRITTKIATTLGMVYK